MAYTPEQKEQMFTSVSDDLEDAAVALLAYVDNTPDGEEANDVDFARRTANALTNAIGSCKVFAKQASANKK